MIKEEFIMWKPFKENDYWYSHINPNNEEFLGLEETNFICNGYYLGKVYYEDSVVSQEQLNEHINSFSKYDLQIITEEEVETFLYESYGDDVYLVDGDFVDERLEEEEFL